MKSRFLSLFTLLVAFGCVQKSEAKFYVPQSDEQFYREVSRHEMAVVHFNPYDEEEEDEANLDRMKDAFFSLANSNRYKNADVAFIGVNLQNIPDLAEDFGIDVPDFEQLEEDDEDVPKEEESTVYPS